ncbi:isoaspartyl peptidase/L-asparaginase family protein [Caulobacter sp. HMWF025]|uniref:isoaspartyl peptidase/L-asparaginase family protein n=2 Tax=unclassified Caulobacter TaxID=2648921 RepID=UPI000D382B4C|nr:isoaspartyl peptidase/L-asparaginase [Caulobacter sp. HMWF025]PTT06342.1 isoaspartyl peptidase/L-asparaginase [Caulobacter sp. HMWF025]
MSSPPHVIALHGGAGVTPGRDYREATDYMRDLAARLSAQLAAGVSAVDCVEIAVLEMEASGLFVAGRGSAPNADGLVEMDASIMDGARHKAGAVCAIRDAASPIAAARRVMEATPHVLLAGQGASDFARQQGLEQIIDPARFFRMPVGITAADIEAETKALAHGTVGAAALDLTGALAAATSTGGVFGKRPGRVGDTPLPGAGVWADDDVAVSCTGVGEYFILTSAAYDVSARLRYRGGSLESACQGMIDSVGRLGGDGGVIAVNRAGQVAFVFNSPGLKRAVAGSSFEPWSGT